MDKIDIQEDGNVWFENGEKVIHVFRRVRSVYTHFNKIDLVSFPIKEKHYGGKKNESKPI